MTAMSDYLEAALTGWFEASSFLSVPTDFYLALFTSATTDAGGGTEVTGGSYARLVVSFTAATSDVDLLFSDLPACTVTHAAIMDASSAGNMLLHGPLTAPKSVAAGDSLLFVAGAIDLSFD